MPVKSFQCYMMGECTSGSVILNGPVQYSVWCNKLYSIALHLHSCRAETNSQFNKFID